MSNTSEHAPNHAAKQNNPDCADPRHDKDRGDPAVARCTPEGSSDFVTVARTADGKLMTKVFTVDDKGREQTRSYDKGYLFHFHTARITCLADLARILKHGFQKSAGREITCF